MRAGLCIFSYLCIVCFEGASDPVQLQLLIRLKKVIEAFFIAIYKSILKRVLLAVTALLT